MTLRMRKSLARMSDEARPFCFHVYRVGGIWGEDKVVKGEDRTTQRYYSKGSRLSTTWQFSLHVGDPTGTLICHVKSPYIGYSWVDNTDGGPIILTMSSSTSEALARRTIPIKRGNVGRDGTYSFKGLDDEDYCWKPNSGLLGNRMQCVNSREQVVATYRVTLLAISKDGELRINQHAMFMVDLLVATCLAMRTPDH